MVDVEKTNDKITENYEKFKPILKKIIQNALAVEKEFGKPQDIEGGITFSDLENFDGEQLYLWQTRNVVK